MKIIIGIEFLEFINTCFADRGLSFSTQHNQCDFGEYDLLNFLKAQAKFDSKYDKFAEKYEFHYNCSDCSFPKFKNLTTGETEACPECGD